MAVYLAIAEYKQGGIARQAEFAGVLRKEEGVVQKDGTLAVHQMQVLSCSNMQCVAGDLTDAPEKLNKVHIGDMQVTVDAESAPVGMLYRAFSEPLYVNWAVYFWRSFHSSKPNSEDQQEHNWFHVYGTRGRIARIATSAQDQRDVISLTLTAYYWEWNDWDLTQLTRHSWKTVTEGPADPQGGSEWEPFTPIVV